MGAGSFLLEPPLQENPMPPKTTCPISRADFLANAKPITIDLGGHPITAEPREFSTGSFGWYVNAKSTSRSTARGCRCRSG